jgi:DNA-binding response OmpR family regulator
VRVLAIDDDRAALEIRKLLLARAGHDVAIAANASDARAAFEQFHPEIVFCDLRLPQLEDGLALIREFHGRARIFVLCGSDTDLHGREESSMVEQVLLKPVRSERLLERLAAKY